MGIPASQTTAEHTRQYVGETVTEAVRLADGANKRGKNVGKRASNQLQAACSDDRSACWDRMQARQRSATKRPNVAVGSEGS